MEREEAREVGGGSRDSGPGHPRLLASTGPLLMTPLGWAMDVIADAGYQEAELLIAHHSDTRDPDKVLAYAAEAGLRVPVVHGPYMIILRRVLGTDYVEKTRRSLEIAAEIGARTMVAHAPFRWERGARRWLADDADGQAAELGIDFAMENLYPVAGRAFSSAITADDLRAYRHVVFDTSHFAVAGIDLFDAWEALADRVGHLHVSDNFGTGRDSHAPIGSGVLPLEAFLAHVGESGYTGTITLELDCRPYLDSREHLVTFLARERVKAEELLTGAVPAPPRPERPPEQPAERVPDELGSGAGA
ncbi:MAG TPA: sugar phosphate isomerase/epimerase family protein [Egibacteraceae bacterium]|nr:sugar phosphate isomerase/epimerase family protein [Egibacteraceae bacterium]